MMFNKKKVLAAAVGALFFVGTANATIATVFNSIPAGTASFINTVTLAGATAASDQLANLPYSATSISRPVSATSPNAYTISNPGGSTIYSGGYGTMSGQVLGIDPYGTGTDPIGYRNSGIEFNFTTAINSIGFEVGDWGTCCQPSALYISFDNGSPIEVGLSSIYGDVFFNNLAEVFVAAFDDSGTFSKVQFWGDGVGEYLVAGGTIRYATLDEGSLPPNGVPEPASLALLGLGLAGIAALRRRKIH